MRTKLQSSVLMILNQFDEEHPITIGQAIDKMGEDKLYRISLELRPVSSFIRNNLAEHNYLSQKNGGYILSSRGIEEKERLERVFG